MRWFQSFYLVSLCFSFHSPFHYIRRNIWSHSLITWYIMVPWALGEETFLLYVQVPGLNNALLNLFIEIEISTTCHIHIQRYLQREVSCPISDLNPLHSINHDKNIMCIIYLYYFRSRNERPQSGDPESKEEYIPEAGGLIEVNRLWVPYYLILVVTIKEK